MIAYQGVLLTYNGMCMCSSDEPWGHPIEIHGHNHSTVGEIYTPKEVYRRCEHCQQLNDDHPGGCTYCGAPMPKS